VCGVIFDLSAHTDVWKHTLTLTISRVQEVDAARRHVRENGEEALPVENSVQVVMLSSHMKLENEELRL